MSRKSANDVLLLTAGGDARVAWLTGSLRSAGFNVIVGGGDENGAPRAAVRILYVTRDDVSRKVVSVLSAVSLLDWEQPWILIAPAEEPYAGLILQKGASPFAYIKLSTKKSVASSVLEQLREWGILVLDVKSPKTTSGNERRRQPKQLHIGWVVLIALCCLVGGMTLEHYLKSEDGFRSAKEQIHAMGASWGLWSEANDGNLLTLPSHQGAQVQPTSDSPAKAKGQDNVATDAATSAKSITREPEGPPQPKIVPVALPVMTIPELNPIQEPKIDPKKRDAFALNLVKRKIEASNRKNGLTDEQMNAVVSSFTDPMFVEGKGNQTREGVRASLSLRQQKWPYWKETVRAVKVEELAEDEVAVRVDSNYWAENPDQNARLVDEMSAIYVVKFSDPNHGLICRVENAPPPPEGPPVPPEIARRQVEASK